MIIQFRLIPLFKKTVILNKHSYNKYSVKRNLLLKLLMKMQTLCFGKYWELDADKDFIFTLGPRLGLISFKNVMALGFLCKNDVSNLIPSNHAAVSILKNDVSLCKHSINLVGLFFLLTVSDVGLVVFVGVFLFFFFFPPRK